MTDKTPNSLEEALSRVKELEAEVIRRQPQAITEMHRKQRVELEAEVERLTAELEASEQPRPADVELCKECERAHGEQLLKALDRAESLKARLEAVRGATSMFRGALAMSISILNRASERHGEPILKEAARELDASANDLLTAILNTPIPKG